LIQIGEIKVDRLNIVPIIRISSRQAAENISKKAKKNQPKIRYYLMELIKK